MARRWHPLLPRTALIAIIDPALDSLVFQTILAYDPKLAQVESSPRTLHSHCRTPDPRHCSIRPTKRLHRRYWNRHRVKIRGSSTDSATDLKTRIWCIDVSDEVDQSVTIDGFDISSEQFPHASFLPSNVHLYTQDIHVPFPEELRGKYDLVVLRFLVTVVDSHSLGPLVENIASLLSECLAGWFSI